MKNEYSKYLPIGTVVMLKNGKKRLMITGYASVDVSKRDKVYDYCGCIYPEGVISTEQTFLFDHDNIDNVYCVGYSDDEQKEFTAKLLETLTPEKINSLLNDSKVNSEG